MLVVSYRLLVRTSRVNHGLWKPYLNVGLSVVRESGGGSISILNTEFNNSWIIYLVSAGVAQDFIEILQPKNTSVWVANGKTRRVAFAYDEAEIDKWLFEILENKGKAVYAYPDDIIIPQIRGGKSVYEKNLVVPETLKSGQYRLKICGWLKDNKKLCQKTAAFHIEGDQIKSKLVTILIISCWFLV